MGRHQIGVVIARLWINMIAPRRLQSDHHVALMKGREDKVVPDHEWIVLGRAPALVHLLPEVCRQAGEESLIVGNAILKAAPPLGAIRQVVGWPGGQSADQVIALVRQPPHVIAGAIQGL